MHAQNMDTSPPKLVRFNPRVAVRPIPQFRSRSLKAKSKLWLSQDEIRKGKQEHGKNSTTLPDDERQQRSQRIFKSKRAVFEEQEEQRQQERWHHGIPVKFGCTPTHMIALAYTIHTTEAAQAAYVRGLKLAQNVLGEQREESHDAVCCFDDHHSSTSLAIITRNDIKDDNSCFETRHMVYVINIIQRSEKAKAA